MCAAAQAGVTAADHLVATIGGRACDVAGGLAERLGRTPVNLRSLGDIHGVADAESLMLVVPWDGIDSALLAELPVRATYCGLSAGLLPAELHAAVTARGDAEPSGRVWAYTMDLDVGRLDVGPGVALFGEAGVAEFLEEVEAGAEAALFNTHGNGFDMRVGDRIVCARIGADPVDGALPCFAGGGCLRGAGPVADPSRYIDPRKLRAEVLILDSCWSVMPRDGLYSAGHGVCEVALRSGTTQAVLAPTQIQSTTPARFASILARYLAGEALGRIALAINGDSLAAAGEPPSWIVIGDPARSGAARMTVGSPQESGSGWLVEPLDRVLSADRLPHDASPVAVGKAKDDARDIHAWVSGGGPGSERLVTALRTPPETTVVRAAAGAARDRARAAVVAALLLRVASGEASGRLLEGLDAQAVAVGLDTPAPNAGSVPGMDDALAAAVTRVARESDGDLLPYWRTWMTAAREDVLTGPCGGRVQRTALTDPTVRRSGRLVARCLTHGALVDRPGPLAEGEQWPDPCSDTHGQPDVSVQVDRLRFTLHRRP